MESASKKSSSYYDSAWRWIEDTYLLYFGENRTSYGVKESFKKADTGNDNVDGIQHSVGGAVGDTVGANGMGAHAENAVDNGVLRVNV